MVMAKSPSFSGASRPKISFICRIVVALIVARTWSILSTIALILPTQSCGPNF